MMKPRNILQDEIRDKAEEFRKQYVKPVDLVPVPIDEILEIDLKITPWPIENLLQKIDIDGFISRDLKNIFIDKTVYIDQRYYRRLRFTFAHEVGHLILHRDDIQNSQFRTEQDWIRFREEFSEEDLFWFEQQAYEFAGRLLVPKKQLITEIEKHRDKINKYHTMIEKNESDLLIKAISRIICDKFDVTEGVILKRIKNEKISIE